MYADIRRLGRPIPNASLQGIEHNPFTTALVSQEEGDGVVALPRENGPWQYRLPEEILAEVLSGKSMGQYRVSVRSVASPQAIEALDKLAKQYKFAYKVPVHEKHWQRTDPVTIYMKQPLTRMEQQAVASAMQPFIFEGDDEALMGEPILNSQKQPYAGVRTNKTPSLLEMANIVQEAYQIDPTLGKGVQAYFNIEAVWPEVLSQTSPGKVAAARQLLSILSLPATS
jgi:hypothetical protein